MTNVNFCNTSFLSLGYKRLITIMQIENSSCYKCYRVVWHLNGSLFLFLSLWRSKFHGSKIVCSTYQCRGFPLVCSVTRNLRGLPKRCTACSGSFRVTVRAFTGQHDSVQRHSLASTLCLSLSNCRQNSLSYCQNARTTSMSKIIPLGAGTRKIIMSPPAL